jgi:hypothetical protein
MEDKVEKEPTLRYQMAIVIASGIVGLTILGTIAFFVNGLASAQDQRRPPADAPKTAPVEADPDRSTIYVWPQPDSGYQSLLVLDVGAVAVGTAELDDACEGRPGKADRRQVVCCPPARPRYCWLSKRIKS